MIGIAVFLVLSCTVLTHQSHSSAFHFHCLLYSQHVSCLIIFVVNRTYWAEMASYFDEHNCEPTDPEEQYRQNALLEMAR